jgi:hypothetical protein
VHAKASTKCPYLTLESPHHQRQGCQSATREIPNHRAATRTVAGADNLLSIDILPVLPEASPCMPQKADLSKSEPARHRFLKPIHNVKDGALPGSYITDTPMAHRKLVIFIPGDMYRPRPRETRRKLVEPIGIEPMT